MTDRSIKRCPACGVDKPLSEFNVCRSRSDGVQGNCRHCQRAHYKAYRAANRDARNQASARYRAEHLEVEREKSRQRAATKRAENPEAARAYAANWRAQNPERARSYWRRYQTANKPMLAGKARLRRADPAMAESNRRTSRIYYANNTLRQRTRHAIWLAANRESERVKDQGRHRGYYQRTLLVRQSAEWRLRQAEATRRWNKRHPDQVRERNALRRARERGATVIERVSRAAIITRDGPTCYLCGLTGLTGRDLTLDHVLPLIRGGPHTAANLRVACRWCNSGKRHRTLAEYRARQLAITQG